MQCIIYFIKQTKTNENKADKTNNVKVTQLLAPVTRETKKLRPTTRKNNKRTPPNPKEETKQRKQHHYFGSQKLFKRPKSKRKTPNISKKLSWTKSALGTNHKSPQGPQEDKTVPRGRPTCSQSSRQQGNNFFSVSIFKKKWTNQHF